VDFATDVGMWNNGSMDGWNSAREPGYGMSYLSRSDLPFYYALADAFTVGDQHFQSTFTQTDPNRVHLFSGANNNLWNKLERCKGAANNETDFMMVRSGSGAVHRAVQAHVSIARQLRRAVYSLLPCVQMDNGEPNPGLNWPTFAETLEEAGVSWKVHLLFGRCRFSFSTRFLNRIKAVLVLPQVYQEEDNFDDNGFAWFKTFQDAQAVGKGHPLFDKGLARLSPGALVDAFAADVANDALPQVSWIVAPAALSEHATNHPSAGEDLSARLLAVLADPKNAKVYAKTAFILNYDEGGQFFDHHWTPTPPATPFDGKSTVETTGEITAEDTAGVVAGTAIGMGFRVPLMVISPWTRHEGGAVYSQVVDHTSQIMLIEKRFGVRCPNISPWRRAVSGDLANVFDFASPPNLSWPPLPNTSSYVANADKHCNELPSPVIPVKQSLPSQEPGVKKSLPLPYDFAIEDTTSSADALTLNMRNTGKAGAVLYVHQYGRGRGKNPPPRRFTIEAGKSLDDTWSANSGANGSSFNLSLHGPNGFVRRFIGDAALAASSSVQLQLHAANTSVLFILGAARASKLLSCAVSFELRDNAYRLGGPWKFVLPADEATPIVHSVGVHASGNWYDFTVTSRSECNSEAFARQFAGRVETGKATITDPAMGNPPPARIRSHPDVPDAYRFFDRTVPAARVAPNALQSPKGAHLCTSQNKDACDYR
jgi:phospholipase C